MTHTDFVIKWQSQVKKGTLAFILLNVLKDHEYYGYELMTHVEEQTKINLGEGTLYALLHRLKAENLVSAKWVSQLSGVPRKYYRLTPHGEQTLYTMHTYWNSLSQRIQNIKS